MNQPLISNLPSIWEKRKKEIFTVIREALQILRQQNDLPKIEDSPTKPNLNRLLARDCFRKAAYRNRLTDLKPTYNSANPPDISDKEPHPRESKKPDFYWQFIDPHADEDSCERRFILECKRLGNPSSPSWKLNENYVKEGICRFVTSPHEYGKGDDACGMIGYVQSMDFDDILCEVNTTAENHPEPITKLQLSPNGWQKGGVSELEHQLTRRFPISPFRLYHFWVALQQD
jgi:hypothetical protein